MEHVCAAMPKHASIVDGYLIVTQCDLADDMLPITYCPWCMIVVRIRGTYTGRTQCSKPNLSQPPKSLGVAVAEALLGFDMGAPHAGVKDFNINGHVEVFFNKEDCLPSAIGRTDQVPEYYCETHECPEVGSIVDASVCFCCHGVNAIEGQNDET